MLLELSSAAALVWWPAAAIPIAFPWIGLILLTLIWLSTVALQVPRHNTLSARFDSMVHRSLVVTNWIRTLAWSVRGLLALWMVLLAMNQ
jgi:hypothetical protein